MELNDSDEENLEALLFRKASERRRKRSRHSPRRGSSPFTWDGDPHARDRRRLSSFTTSSGDETAVSIDDADMTDEEILENMRLYKQVIESIKNQPWRMKTKYKTLRRAKAYVNKHEGELVHSKRSKDIVAKYKLLLSKWFQRLERGMANLVVTLTPWAMRIKRIESHFGSVVASYFTFLRWVFWINFFITTFVCCFLMVPEVLRGQDDPTGMRKEIETEEQDSALNLKAIWDFEGYLKYSPIFYGYYSNREMTEEGYRLPLAYFLTSLAVYVFSFVAILRRMAENSRMSKMSEKDEECTFSWKLFTGWDYMIGNAETALNKSASLIMSFKEAILEEKEKKKDERNWKVIVLRTLANFTVILLLASSAYAVVLVVKRSQEPEAESTWWRQNEVSILVKNSPHKQMCITSTLCSVENDSLGSYITTALFELKTNLTVMLEQTTVFSTILTSTESYSTSNTTVMEPSRSLVGLSLKLSEPGLDRVQTDMNTCNIALLVNCTTVLLSWVRNSIGKEKLNFLEKIKPFLSRNKTLKKNYFSDHDDDDGISTETFSNFLNFERENETVEWFVVWNDTNTSALINTTRDLNNQWNISIATLLTSNNQTDSFQDDALNRTFESFFESTNASQKHNILSLLNTTLWQWLSINSTDFNGNVPDSLENCLKLISNCVTHTEENDGLTSSSASTDPRLTNANNETSNTTEILARDSEIPPTSTIPDCGDRDCISYYSEQTTGSVSQEMSTLTTKCEGKECSTEEDIVGLILQGDDSIKEQLRKLCWETMFGQELVKLTVMDLVMTIISIILMDFLRAVFVRYANKCWCWDLEKKFPGYGDFKIAENILHLVNNQGMIWMGMFFSPGLPAINTVKLCILLYVRSWAVMTCNIPHDTVFKASRSNNFYYALLLIMLFLCTLPVGFSIVWLEPSWHCGPFSGYSRIYRIFTSYLEDVLPSWMNKVIEYITSPGVVIPLLLLLVLIIYYMISLTGSLREANNDLKIQLRRERTEEKKKVYAMADGKGEDKSVGTRWSSAKKILPVLPTCNKFRALSRQNERVTDRHDEERNVTRGQPNNHIETRVKRHVKYSLASEENPVDAPETCYNSRDEKTDVKDPEEPSRRETERLDTEDVPVITISHPADKGVNKNRKLTHQRSTDRTSKYSVFFRNFLPCSV
ncbi:transmembrane channel-like protein 3 [Limulus polyphemus]|uniref:Transmembrane channel-like protein 3 n=1 Tax=Limulus polyphemus TaxID=6850 RepID=A0ABM1TCN8_LIMPO|nr:transmembrane channel-like protein 3 [Limulus polyphemus]